MTWLLVALLVLTNAWWLLVTVCAGQRMLKLESAARDMDARQRDILQVLHTTQTVLLQLLAQIPTARGH